jgi:hypothetical protein
LLGRPPIKLLVILCLVAGGSLAFWVLRSVRGNWDGFWELGAIAAGLNAVVGLIAYGVFRRARPELSYYRLGLVLAYAAGLASGEYLYFK